MQFLLKWIVRLASVLFLLAIIGVATVIGGIWYFGRDLPDYRALAGEVTAMEPATLGAPAAEDRAVA